MKNLLLCEVICDIVRMPYGFSGRTKDYNLIKPSSPIKNLYILYLHELMFQVNDKFDQFVNQ